MNHEARPGTTNAGSSALCVRVAGPRDAEALALLRFEFRNSVAAAVEPEDEFVARCTVWMRQRLAAGSGWRAWALDADGALSGHLWLQSIDKVPNPVEEPERHGYITNVYVRPGMRGRGAGSALLDAAVSWCREAAIDAVILWPTPASRSLYARHGFTATYDILELRLAR